MVVIAPRIRWNGSTFSGIAKSGGDTTMGGDNHVYRLGVSENTRVRRSGAGELVRQKVMPFARTERCRHYVGTKDGSPEPAWPSVDAFFEFGYPSRGERGGRCDQTGMADNEVN